MLPLHRVELTVPGGKGCWLKNVCCCWGGCCWPNPVFHWLGAGPVKPVVWYVMACIVGWKKNNKFLKRLNHLQYCSLNSFFLLSCEMLRRNADVYFHSLMDINNNTQKMGNLHLHWPCYWHLALDGMYGGECADSCPPAWRLLEGTDLRWGCLGPLLPPLLAGGMKNNY